MSAIRTMPEDWEKGCTKVLRQVFNERKRQHANWGEQNHPFWESNPGSKIIAEVMKQKCDEAHQGGFLTWRHILEGEYREVLAKSDPQKFRTELIQLAAVAVQMVEAIDRRVKA